MSPSNNRSKVQLEKQAGLGRAGAPCPALTFLALLLLVLTARL
jgi:hypothetical protein